MPNVLVGCLFFSFKYLREDIVEPLIEGLKVEHHKILVQKIRIKLLREQRDIRILQEDLSEHLHIHRTFSKKNNKKREQKIQ